MKLEELLRSPEGKTLEYRRDLSSPKPVLRTLVAFANAAGGRLVLGIEDGTRHVAGVTDPLALEGRIASLVVGAVEPRLLPEIEIVPWRKTRVVVVTVHPSALRPHHVVAEGPERGTYVRLGSASRLADAALTAELARRTGTEGFDEEPLADLDSEAIDFAAASRSGVSCGAGTWRRWAWSVGTRGARFRRSAASCCSAESVSRAFRTPTSRWAGSR